MTEIAKNKYTAAKQKSVVIRMSVALHEQIKAFSLKNDMSMTNMIIQSVKERMK